MPFGAAHGVRAESAGRRRRGVAQEAGDAVEEVASLEEAAEHLRVVGVQPLAAGFDRVPAGHDREVVLQLEALHQLVDVRRQEERIAKAERWSRTRSPVSAGIGDGVAERGRSSRENVK